MGKTGNIWKACWILGFISFDAPKKGTDSRLHMATLETKRMDLIYAWLAILLLENKVDFRIRVDRRFRLMLSPKFGKCFKKITKHQLKKTNILYNL